MEFSAAGGSGVYGVSSNRPLSRQLAPCLPTGRSPGRLGPRPVCRPPGSEPRRSGSWVAVMQCVAQAGGGRPGRWPPGSRPSGVQFSRCFRGHQRASQKSDGPPRNTSAVMLREAAGGVKIPPTPAPHRKSKGNQEGFAFQPGWAGLSGLRVNLMIIMTSSQSWLEHSRVSEKGEVLKMFREGS